jgi:hypothetical protein
MENKEFMTGALDGQVYEAPRVEVLEVMVERGYGVSSGSEATALNQESSIESYSTDF